jgi:hypothetical protein
MNKIKFMLAMYMLAVLITSASPGRSSPKHYNAGGHFTDVLNLYAFNGTKYTELVSSGDLDNGFTTTSSGWPATITNASGTQEPLVTYTGTKYYLVYATDSW